jgi:glycosyltransferase involved in cell wall biosynthesis
MARIAVNTRFLLPDRLEGIGWYTHEIVRRLVVRRPDDEFIFLFDRPYDERFVYSERVTPVVVPPPARHPLLWYIWFEQRLPKILARRGAEVFLSLDGYCSLRARTPTIMVTHDIAHVHYPRQVPRLTRKYYDSFVPRYLQRAERVGVVSNFVRRDILSYYGIEAHKLFVAGNGVRPEFRPASAETRLAIRQKYADGRPYFFFLGAVHPRKNVRALIEAYNVFRRWVPATVPLLIAGRLAWQNRDVRHAHRNSPYRHDIRFLDYVPNELLPQLMGSALALTYVSLFEGFGVPLLEAMHCEIPIITSNTSSLPEVAGDAALLVDPRNKGQIAEAMRRIYTDPILAGQLVDNGRRQREQYTWDRSAEVVDGELSRLLGE